MEYEKPETDALEAGVKKHGVGKWKRIKEDPDYAEALKNRTTNGMREKWHTLHPEYRKQMAEHEKLILDMIEKMDFKITKMEKSLNEQIQDLAEKMESLAKDVALLLKKK